MPRGGARPGAGRKAGSVNKTNAVRQEKAAATGAMPVDVMLDAMRYHYDRAIKAKGRRPKGAENKEKNLELVRVELSLAHNYAKDVAPFYHPKLATLQSNVNLTGRLTLEALVEQSMALPPPANENAQLPAPVDETENGVAAE